MHMRAIAALIALALLTTPSMAQAMNASFYARAFQGKTMANGKPFNMYALTVAHKTLPLGMRVCVVRGGKKVKAYVTDRGPYVKGRDIDLSYAVAKQVGIVERGTGLVDVYPC